ncbi:MAG: FtsX-like permease family protein, partial [Anaerolineae bacterium]
FGPLVAGLAAYYPAKRAAAVDVVTATRSEHVALTKTKSVRPESRRKLARSLVWTLAWRSLDAHRTRAVLSAVAVGLSVTMIIATDVISGAIINILARSEDVQAAMGGLLEQLDGLLAIVGVAISGTAAFLVFNVFAMSVAQRRQQIGSLRSLGMIRRQVMALILSEALIVSGVGSALGLLLGPLVGRGMLAFLRTLGTAFSGFGDSVLPAQSALLAVALGMGMTLLATLIPAWGATRVSPLSALRQQGANGVKSPAVKPRVGALAAMPAMIAYLLLNPPGEWLLPPQSYWLAVLLSLVWLICLALVLPALINLLAKRLRAPLTRLGGAAGRLMADNLQRARRRVTLTIAGLVIGLTLVVGMTGFFAFWMDELMGVSIGRFEYEGAWGIYAFDIMGGTGAVAGLDSLQISDEATADLRAIAAGQADLAEVYFVIVPEFSFLGDSYFSFIMSPRQLKRVGSTMFSFSEGTWETAMPLMEAGCGVLTTPAVANMNGVGLGDTLIVQGKSGPVECTVAGLGTTFVGATFISSAAGESFGVKKPMAIFVSARPGSDPAQLEQDLMALQNRHSNIYAVKMTDYTHLVRQTMRLVKGMMGAILFLTIVLAALGVVNVTVISVAERRREFGLLRGVGATRRQVQTVIVGEAGLMGLVGGGLGLVAGAGITFILVMVLGGQMMGIELDLLPAAWRSLKPALLNGLTGLLAAPFIAAGAAWLPARSILRGSAIETIQPERRQQPLSPRRAVGRLWRWGSLRARFTLGTGLLMTLVLAALITVITLHARIRLQEQVHDAVRTMVAWNAGLVELNLPEEATNLTLETLTAGGGPFSFDADAMLRFRSMMDGLTEQGLVDFAIADRDNVTLVSLNVNDIGTVLPELGARDEATATSVRAEGEWLVYAAAPVRNDDGAPVGSVRLTLNARELQDFLSRLRSGLALAGGIIILLGLALSWGLTTPLVTATRQLAAHAADVGRGEFIPFRRSPRFQWLDRLSLRTKLTGAMVFILVLMVAVLQLIAIPIERRRIDTTLKRNLTAGAEWVGQAASESFDASRFNLSPTNLLTLNELLRQTQTLDMAHLQRLTEQLRSDDVAYIALIDRDGTITLSDQLELIGEGAPAPPETQIKADLWRGDDVWVVSTPLRRGRDGEQVGALRMAVRRERVETFLNESRSLFRLTGLIAVLAGVLLAPAIGGAVTAPVRQLAAGTRRVAGGDLSARFRVERHDELAILADAYNRMVVGLQEREWLRDMFGRFVSREVAEAIRAGQVRLEGENRVVSILFCDIRGFTQRSERATPAEMVALLNEYLPLVVSAAQRHEGTVNKFGGDSTLVIYGAPKPLQESAYHAVLTALDMRVNLTRLNERLAERGEAPIRIGVGINTGVALAGAVGPQERQEYTVIGDAVNLASRIEALNKDYPAHDILISGQTYAALGSRRKEFAFADLGFVQIRGKVEPVQVWAVVKRA